MLQKLVTEIVSIDGLQWWATGFGLLEVWWAYKNKIWLYPAGIIATALSTYLLSTSGLYAEAILNCYYLIMSVWGWWKWLNRSAQTALPISYCQPKDWLIAILIATTSFLVFFVGLTQYTNSTVPFADAVVSAFAWSGMWLLAKRKIENWIWLNISNIIAIPLLVQKELFLFVVFTAFLFFMGCLGFFKWRKLYRATANDQSLMLSHA